MSVLHFLPMPAVNPTTIEKRFAICVVQNDQAELLLVKRTQHRNFNPGLWGFPGGHIETNEAPVDCAWRELREEIGTDHQVELLTSAGPFIDRHYGGRFEAWLFHYRWSRGTITLNAEHSEYVWVGLNSLHDYELMPGIDDDLDYLGLRS